MRDSTRTATVIPNPGLRNLYCLLNALRGDGRTAPAAHVRGLHLAWSEADKDAGSIVVSMTEDTPCPVAFGQIHADGMFVTEKTCRPEEVLALRNFAADPERKLRRFGFDEQACPFCGIHLPYGTLAFNIGHCEECALLVGWPFDQFTADCAEGVLRADIQRELEEEDREG